MQTQGGHERSEPSQAMLRAFRCELLATADEPSLAPQSLGSRDRERISLQCAMHLQATRRMATASGARWAPHNPHYLCNMWEGGGATATTR